MQCGQCPKTISSNECSSRAPTGYYHESDSNPPLAGGHSLCPQMRIGQRQVSTADASEESTQENGNHSCLPHGNSLSKCGVRIFSDCPQLQAKTCSVNQEPTSNGHQRSQVNQGIVLEEY